MRYPLSFLLDEKKALMNFSGFDSVRAMSYGAQYVINILITACKRSCGKVMFSQASVIPVILLGKRGEAG